MELTMARVHSLERILVGAALVVLTVLAWAYMVTGDSSGDMAMPVTGSEAQGWNLHLLNVSVIMWVVMMVAMMLPGAAPMIMTYIRVHQRRVASHRAVAPTWVFMAGYLVVWAGFGVTAATTQWMLHQTSMLSSAMGHVAPLSGAALLILAGAYQFSRLKQSCLGKCQSPLGFLMTEWREWSGRCIHYGRPARCILCRLLLGADAADVCGRGDESGLDGWAGILLSGRKTGPLAATVQPRDGRSSYSCGNSDDRGSLRSRRQALPRPPQLEQQFDVTAKQQELVRQDGPFAGRPAQNQPSFNDS